VIKVPWPFADPRGRHTKDQAVLAEFRLPAFLAQQVFAMAADTGQFGKRSGALRHVRANIVVSGDRALHRDLLVDRHDPQLRRLLAMERPVEAFTHVRERVPLELRRQSGQLVFVNAKRKGKLAIA
jgi:hypothetical protein